MASSQTPRGLRRKSLILEAAIELSLESGLGAITHRGIAEHATVPLGSTTYYFEALADIQEAAARSVTEQLVSTFRSELEDLGHTPEPEAIVEPLLRVLLPTGVDTAQVYHWYLDAVRIEGVRSVIAKWNADIVSLLSQYLALDEVTAEEVLALADGLLLNSLGKGEQPDKTAGRISNAIVAHLGMGHRDVASP